MYCDDDRIVKF